MSKTTFFGPGPSQLYPGIDRFIQDALAQDVCSISHRSQAFKDIYKETADNLRKLIDLPDNYEVVFLPSATEAWERIVKNLVDKKSFHFTNGSFSKKFYSYSKDSGKEAINFSAPFGEGFDVSQAEIPADTEVICFTQNETSSGVNVPLKDIYSISEKNPEALVAVDVVSSLPIPAFDFSKIDTAFFSVQKCFGMPAGLGVWLVNDRCLAKAKSQEEKGVLIGPHHALPELFAKAQEYQNPCTPNALGIYVLGRVCKAMLDKGIDTLRAENEKKSTLLHDFIAESPLFTEAVEKPEHRSKTVVVANTTVPAGDLNKYLAQFDLNIGSGYGAHKLDQVRIANFPAHSVEVIEKLVEALKNYK